MNVNEIHEELFRNRDAEYQSFQVKLLPTLNPNTVIGVRTPVLRKLAKALYKENDFTEFINNLPHEYFDENQLHALLISEIKDFERCIEELNKFLPCVDNWATCDQMSPKVFKKHKEGLPEQIKTWLVSQKPYTVRFAIGMLMEHFLDDAFDMQYPRLVSEIRSEEYYVNMMIAWYFSTALAKRYEETLPFLENKTLDRWTHNKTIQKALESYRISDGQKRYLRTLKL